MKWMKVKNVKVKGKENEINARSGRMGKVGNTFVLDILQRIAIIPWCRGLC